MEICRQKMDVLGISGSVSCLGSVIEVDFLCLYSGQEWCRAVCVCGRKPLFRKALMFEFRVCFVGKAKVSGRM